MIGIQAFRGVLAGCLARDGGYAVSLCLMVCLAGDE